MSNELSNSLCEKQSKSYSGFILALQRMINVAGDSSASTEAMIEFQREVLQVALYGDDDTAAASVTYFNLLIASAKSDDRLAKIDHQRHQRRILNAMRASMGLKPLDLFEFVGIGPKCGG